MIQGKYYSLKMDLTAFLAPYSYSNVNDDAETWTHVLRGNPVREAKFPKGTIVYVESITIEYDKWGFSETLVDFRVPGMGVVRESFNGAFTVFFDEVDQSAAKILFGAG